MTTNDFELPLGDLRHDNARLVVVEPEDDSPSAALCDSCEWATIAGTLERAQELARRHLSDAGGQGTMTTSVAGLRIYRPGLFDRLEELRELRAPFDQFDHPSRGNAG